MPRRAHTSALVQARWGCDGCAAKGAGANSQALAAQHHDKRGHRTWSETTRRVTYGSVTGKTRADGQRSML